MGVTGAARLWDQRAVAVVQLSGTSTDFDLFEEEIRARDWKVLYRNESSEVASTGEGGCRYTVEVRFPGSAIRSPNAAREHLEVVSDRLSLDLLVEAVQRIERDPVELPLWYVYRPLPSDEPAAVASWTRRLRARFLVWCATTLGTRDTGRQVRAATEDEARAWATRVLPGTGLPPADVSVRHSMNVTPSVRSDPPPRRRAPMWRLAMLRFPALVALVCGAWVALIRGSGPWWFVLPAVLFFLVAAGTAVLIVRWSAVETSSLRAPFFGLAVVSAAAIFGAGAVATAPDEGGGFVVIVVGLAFGYLVGTGVWLWLRQSSWARVLPWLLPAVLGFAPGLFPGLGVSLPTFYLDAFDVHGDDIEVPAIMKVLAAFTLLASMSIWLIAPAMLGYMRHTHHMITSRGIGYAAVVVVSFSTLTLGVLGLAVQPALMAGQKAVAAAAAGRTPPHYFGIEPEWVCASPVKPLDQVPVDGGTLDPARSYLSLGDSGGIVVLWDVRAATAIKIPLSALRLAPVDDPRRPCA